MNPPKIIGIDFDGTCVTHDYPDIGQDIGAVPVLRELLAAGHKLVLWTMRADGRDDGSAPLADAVGWFEQHGLELWGANENPEQHVWTASPKAYCHLYIDDAALGCPLVHPPVARPHVDWAEVRQNLESLGLIPSIIA